MMLLVSPARSNLELGTKSEPNPAYRESNFESFERNPGSATHPERLPTVPRVTTTFPESEKTERERIDVLQGHGATSYQKLLRVFAQRRI